MADQPSIDAVGPKHLPVVLVILDGWGLSAGVSGNAIRQANPSTFVRLWHEHPHGVLRALSPVDEAVGLAGSSETGHASIGTGRLFHADLSDLQLAIASGSFFAAPGFTELTATTQANRRTAHVIGLVSDHSSHGRTEVLLACLELLKRQQVSDVVVHALLDTVAGPIAAHQLKQLARELADRDLGRLGSVGGRTWALDRSGDWQRTREAYRALIRGTPTSSLEQVLADLAEHEALASELEPVTIASEASQSVGAIRAGDTVLLTTTRADRSLQLTRALGDRTALAWVGLVRTEPFLGLHIWTLTDLHLELPDVLPVFRSAAIGDPLGRIIADHGLRQARIMTADRAAAMTFYLNGGHGEPYDHEQRIVVADRELTARTIDAVRSRQTSFIAVNLAAVDEAAHTGDPAAAIAAVQSVDAALSEISQATLSAGGTLIVTADHGNAESILPSRAGHHHTTNGVPWIVATAENRRPTRIVPSRLTFPSGFPDHHHSLADVAPTVLGLLGIAKPSTMTGQSLV